MPFNHPWRTAILEPLAFGHWVGMNGDWIAAMNSARIWFLANVYTKKVVYLTSTVSCNITRNIFIDVYAGYSNPI